MSVASIFTTRFYGFYGFCFFAIRPQLSVRTFQMLGVIMIGSIL